MPDTENTEKTFTQDDLNRIAAENKARGEREAKKAFEEQLKALFGDLTPEEVAGKLRAVREAEDAQKTEAQRILEEATAAKTEAEKIKAEAAQERHTARLHAALISAGVPEAGVGAVTVPGVEVGATVEEIQAAVDKLKTTLPGLFKTTTSVDADPGRGPTPTPPAGEFGAAGRAEFERRFPDKVAS